MFLTDTCADASCCLQAFTLYHHDPDYTCDSITVEEAMRDFGKLVDRHAPVIIKGAAANWPFPPAGQTKPRLHGCFAATRKSFINAVAPRMAGWTEEEISRRSGHEVVDVAFTEADGHLNRFEPMEKWSHVFKDKHWQVNDVVRSLVKLHMQVEQERRTYPQRVS